MTSTPASSASHAAKFRAGGTWLVHCDDSAPGITRSRRKHGWAYFDPAGERITDRAEIDRLNRIALPPAYRDAWFCPADNGHLLATGIDARGRKQYRYHPDFRRHRDAGKFADCARFGHLLPLVRRRVEDDLQEPRPTRERAIASVVRLLDSGQIRVGNESYAKANKSFGATTLRMRHVAVKGSTLRLRFTAKSGRQREMTITDRNLARFVRTMGDLPGQHLFQYLDDAGETHPVGSHDVNQYLAETMGEPFTAKTFRTWHASVIALTALAQADGVLGVRDVALIVSGRLGNTPAIARKSYIHPDVLALVDRQQEWRKTLQLPRETRWLSREERALIALIGEVPGAVEIHSVV